jgi:adenine phosphoribosyltransferase
MIRKANKLPPETLRVSYKLEYGSDHLEIRKGLLRPADRVLIVDDVLATGGTLLASKQLIEMAGARVCGALTLLEIAFLDGSKKLAQQNLPFRAALCV